eukprot:1997635-Pyramimonas_sp.AAC.1
MHFGPVENSRQRPRDPDPLRESTQLGRGPRHSTGGTPRRVHSNFELPAALSESSGPASRVIDPE